jgi:outer membrane receptor protein involved in Fe transport
VKNLFDKFYWVNVGADAYEDADGILTPVYRRTGIPSPPRMIALTLRFNIF